MKQRLLAQRRKGTRKNSGLSLSLCDLAREQACLPDSSKPLCPSHCHSRIALVSSPPLCCSRLLFALHVRMFSRQQTPRIVRVPVEVPGRTGKDCYRVVYRDRHSSLLEQRSAPQKLRVQKVLSRNHKDHELKRCRRVLMVSNHRMRSSSLLLKEVSRMRSRFWILLCRFTFLRSRQSPRIPRSARSCCRFRTVASLLFEAKHLAARVSPIANRSRLCFIRRLSPERIESFTAC